MKKSFPSFVLLVVAVLLTTARLAAASCATDDPDGSRTMAARASAEEACTNAGAGCSNAANHGAYVSCIAHAINGLVQGNTLPKSCKGTVKKCAARSTCGKPGAVTCCLANQGGHGHSKCSVMRDAGSCTAKGGCAGSFVSCCDACAPDGSCNPPPTTTTTTTTLLPPVTTTTL
jgi:hypothetical protein